MDTILPVVRADLDYVQQWARLTLEVPADGAAVVPEATRSVKVLRSRADYMRDILRLPDDEWRAVGPRGLRRVRAELGVFSDLVDRLVRDVELPEGYVDRSFFPGIPREVLIESSLDGVDEFVAPRIKLAKAAESRPWLYYNPLCRAWYLHRAQTVAIGVAIAVAGFILALGIHDSRSRAQGFKETGSEP